MNLPWREWIQGKLGLRLSAAVPRERCALCGRNTGIPVICPIDRRDYYVEGAGQLCRKCWQKLYGSRKDPPAARRSFYKVHAKPGKNMMRLRPRRR